MSQRQLSPKAWIGRAQGAASCASTTAGKLAAYTNDMVSLFGLSAEPLANKASEALNLLNEVEHELRQFEATHD